LLNGIESSIVLADRVEEPFAFVGRTIRRIRRAVASWLPANRARQFARWAMAFFFVLGLFQLMLLIGVTVTPVGLRRALTLSVATSVSGSSARLFS
jgi:hypothetical protein